MRRILVSAVAVTLSVLTLVAVFSCEKEDVLLPDRNLPPETMVTEAPMDSTQVNFRVHMFWYGRDADGIVEQFRFAIDDTVEPGSWTRTSNTDTMFVFTANDPLLRYHEFFVAAIDNEGKADPTPAFRRFFARDDFMPEVWMLDAPLCSLSAMGDTVGCLPPLAEEDTLMITDERPVYFSWSGRDRDGEIVAYAYKLDSNPYRWVGRDTSTALYPAPRFLSSGPHTFFLKARDDASAEMSPSFRYRFVVNLDSESVIDSLYYIPFGTNDWIPVDFSTGTVPGILPDGCSIEVLWHGTDVDGSVERSLVQPSGPDLRQQQDWSSGWMEYPDSTRWRSVALNGTLDDFFVLKIFTLDNRRRSEGTPALAEFEVNQPPAIDTLWVEVEPEIILDGGVPVDTVCVATFHWAATDPDNDIGAPVRFFYKVDGVVFLPPGNEAARDFWETEIAPGSHTFEVRGYNYNFDPRVRFGSRTIAFEVDNACGLSGP